MLERLAGILTRMIQDGIVGHQELEIELDPNPEYPGIYVWVRAPNNPEEWLCYGE